MYNLFSESTVPSSLLSDHPDVVVGTPWRIWQQIQNGALSIKDSLEMLVIDEADLVFSFGYENDVKSKI